MSEKRRLLLTGASGFIGSFLLDEALSRNYDVYVAVRPTTRLEKFKGKNIQIVTMNFSDSNDVQHKLSSLPPLDYVVHNAGATKPLHKKEFHEVNCENTRRLLTALTVVGKIPRKFLFMSSLAAYGPAPDGIATKVTNQMTPKPLTRYGESKLAAEQFIMNQQEVPFLILRPTAVYGPGDEDFFKTIYLNNKGIDFRIGRHPQKLTFVYVKDLARLVFDALESPVVNKAYFVADGNVYGKADFGMIVAKHLHKKMIAITIPVWLAKLVAMFSETWAVLTRKPTILYVEKINELAAASWDCDIEPLKKELQFEAKYTLEKGLAETIEWCKKEGWLK